MQKDEALFVYRSPRKGLRGLWCNLLSFCAAPRQSWINVALSKAPKLLRFQLCCFVSACKFRVEFAPCCRLCFESELLVPSLLRTCKFRAKTARFQVCCLCFQSELLSKFAPYCKFRAKTASLPSLLQSELLLPTLLCSLLGSFGLDAGNSFGKNQADAGNSIRREAAGNIGNSYVCFRVSKGENIEKEHDLQERCRKNPARAGNGLLPGKIFHSYSKPKRRPLEAISLFCFLTMKFACSSTEHWQLTQLVEKKTVKLRILKKINFPSRTKQKKAAN